MYNDRLNGLLALKAVSESLNFTLAAKRLGISPSAVSQAVKLLEKRLGVALLARTTRSTSLTEAGSRFMTEAGPALDQVLGALDNIGTYARKPSGLLRINLPRQLYQAYLHEMIAGFLSAHPEISLELYFEDQASDVIGKGFDAGIRLSDILAKDMVALKLVGPVRFVAAASPQYLDKAGRPKHPEELLSHNCICPLLGAGLYDRWEFEHKGRDFQVQVKGSLITNDSHVSMEAAMAGLGIFYTFADAIKDKVRSGKLEIVLKSFSCSSEGFYLYYPKRAQVLPKLRAFIEYFKSHNPG